GPGRVSQAERDRPHTQERVASEETHAGADLSMLRLLLERRTLRDESRYEQDGGDVRTGVDEQHACRTNGADEDAREHRARKQRRPGGRLEERVGFRDLLLPFTEELG